MATSRIETTVANPPGRARQKRRPNVAKMTRKQIRFFGTKRQRAALKRKRSNPKPRAKAHRPRTAPRRAVKRRTNSPRAAARAPRKRRNTGLILSLAPLAGNPAKRGQKTMAKTKRRRAAQRSNAGRPRRRAVMNTRRRHSIRPNPGAFGKPMDWMEGGAGVIVGVTGTRGIPQMVLGAKNVGATGYLANAITTAALAFLSHMVFPRRPVLTGTIIAGGVAAILSRVIGDYSLLGSYSSKVGLGDHGVAGFGLYMPSNFAAPQRLINPRNSAMVEIPQGWGGAAFSVPASVVASDNGITGMAAC